MCKVATCIWRVHCSRLPDGVTWKIKSLKGPHSCPRLQENKMASHPWFAPLFKRIFTSFGAMITGFTRGYRPFIGVDGCFLKGPYKGVLLTAMGLDANNGYFPLAYGVVEKENKDNWGYFFKALRVCLQDTDLSKYTFISDRHKVCIFFFYICLLFLPCFS